MRSIALGATALGLLVTDSLVAAGEVFISGHSKAVRGDGYLSIPVGTVQRPASSKRAAKTFQDKLYNVDAFYATYVDIGEPPQQVAVLVDTGSSELWVNPDCRTAAIQEQARCVKFGKYDPLKSSKSIGPFGHPHEINYGDPSDVSSQTSATILYFADALSLGGAKISNQTFGLVAKSQGQSQGILGLAPDVEGGYDGNKPYSLVLSSMAEQGLIASRVYSLDLRHSDSDYGAVIFGGLDKSKFIGTLEKRPIVNGIEGEYRLAVELSKVGVTRAKSSSFKVAGPDSNVMLDSGATLSRLHAAVAMPITEALGARDNGDGLFRVPCSTRNSAGSVDFGFGKKKIRVPLKDFIRPGTSKTRCYVGLVLTTGQQILGDSVLRAGYFVFDWDNQEVHIAQAANCGNEDIVAVSSGKRAVPSATGNCKDSDAALAGGSQATRTKGDSIATKAYTNVYTVTSCPPSDQTCRTGVVTTQVVPAATDTGDANNAGVGAAAVSGLLMIVASLAMVHNVL